MNLTPGESLILKMLINIKIDFAAFSDMVTAKLFASQMTDENAINEFNSDINKLKKEKQNEIVAQLKNLYSDKLGDIDDTLNDLLSEN